MQMFYDNSIISCMYNIMFRGKRYGKNKKLQKQKILSSVIPSNNVGNTVESL